MTAATAGRPYDNVQVASKADLRASIAKAEQRSGFSYDELAEQARAGRFKTFQARLAWVAVAGLRDLLSAG